MSPLYCLALVIAMEANGEPPAGQLAVARVVLNRAEHKPENICKVIKEPGQFSWVGKRQLIKPTTEHYRIAKFAMLKRVDFPATHFHNLTVNPNWPYNYLITIGNHKFYVQNKNRKSNHASRTR